MQDKKDYYYSISWQQAYTNWPSSQWLDEAAEAIVEYALEHTNFAEAKAVIEQVKKL